MLHFVVDGPGGLRIPSLSSHIVYDSLRPARGQVSEPAVTMTTNRQNGRVKTIQLRRYTLVDGEYDDFVAWWRDAMPAVRPPAGFTIEFAYGLRESNEFVWAVSVPGDRDEFARLEEAYMASDERAAVFAGVPQRVAVYDIRFVDDDTLAD
jgi:hypothetical protein